MCSWQNQNHLQWADKRCMQNKSSICEIGSIHHSLLCETSKCALKSNDGNTANNNFSIWLFHTVWVSIHTLFSMVMKTHLLETSSLKSIMKPNILYVPAFIRLFLKTLHCPLKRWESRELSVRSHLSSCTFSVTEKHHLDRSLLSCSFSLLNRTSNKPGRVIHS